MFPFFSELLLVEEELGRFSTVLRLGEGHETRWQRMVARRWDFDPEQHYPESFAYLNLSNEVAQWKIYTADELRRRDQQGHQSLREKYGK